MLGQQRLQVRLDAVLHQSRVHAELVAGVVLDVLDGDAQLLARLVLDHPHRRRSPASSVSQHGGDIQFSGL